MEPTTSEAPSGPRILVGTDFSPTAAVAVEWAVELARQQGARVELVHAVTVPPSVPEYVSPGAIAPGPLFDAEVRSAALARLEREAASLHEKGIEVDTWLALGTPSMVIADRATETSALAIVIGTRGLTGLRHVLLGSTTERVVQKAPCPVLTVHPEDKGRHRTLRTIVVPTDFSADAERAIHTAQRLLAPLAEDARLILVHAFNLPIEYTAYGPIPTSVRYLQDTGLEAERRLQELTDRLTGEGLAVDSVAREGDPSQVIVEEAERRGADLIAMGTHGRSGLRHLFLGSTAERVVQHATCPVMTVRRPI
ncbi:MAG TPA: universal stress protein [Thermoanaerobaculia bacterium]|nr:universal stress protein [Thermoanaerobaculia bacterium]